ncbi:hypothetical protein LQW54_002333 [Pestalotiopsis sp. IQ-011]
MAAYTQRLLAYTPAQNKPVTEIAIFKLNTEFAADHDAAAMEFESQIIEQAAPGKPFAKGIRRERPDSTCVWMLDWEKIQDHWEFWQTPGFPPIINAINKLFIPGRPLVRHYDFGGQGMIETTWVRLFIWDEKMDDAAAEVALSKVLKNDAIETAPARRQGYAVYVVETTWCCPLIGYKDERRAVEEEIQQDFSGEDHVLDLKYLSKPKL